MRTYLNLVPTSSYFQTWCQQIAFSPQKIAKKGYFNEKFKKYGADHSARRYMFSRPWHKYIKKLRELKTCRGWLSQKFGIWRSSNYKSDSKKVSRISFSMPSSFRSGNFPGSHEFTLQFNSPISIYSWNQYTRRLRKYDDKAVVNRDQENWKRWINIWCNPTKGKCNEPIIGYQYRPQVMNVQEYYLR